MNVILLEKIGKLGEIGDTASVKSGYARNYLFPQGKAIPATRENLAEFEVRKTELMAAHNEKVAHAQSRAAKVEGITISIEVNASEEGRLFGSVGTRDIAEAVNEKTGGDLEKSEVLLPHGVIRELGEYEIDLDLGFEVGATIAISVVGSRSGSLMDDGSIIGEIDQAEAGEETAGPADEAGAAGEDGDKTE